MQTGSENMFYVNRAVPEHIDDTLLQAVRQNCSIADARGAADYTLCVYLMKMREYYRWHMQIDYEKALDSSELGQWIRQAEIQWDLIEETQLTPIPLPGGKTDPFDSNAINQAITDQKLVYSAGYGQGGKPHFFLAQLQNSFERQSFRVFISNEEYARDLVSPIAMTQGDTIYIRQQALERLLWEKSLEISWNAAKTPMARCLCNWDFATEPESSMRQAATHLQSVLIDHEIGEFMTGKHLGKDWESMLLQHLGSRLELQLRAVRDTVADLLSTLPHLIEAADPVKIHFYMGLLSPLRKIMLADLIKAYEEWLDTENLNTMNEFVQQAVPEWLSFAEELVAINQGNVVDPKERLTECIESRFKFT